LSENEHVRDQKGQAADGCPIDLERRAFGVAEDAALEVSRTLVRRPL
jgi:hypothetical protein